MFIWSFGWSLACDLRLCDIKFWLRTKCLCREKLNSMNLLLYMSPIAVLVLLPSTLVMEPNVLEVILELGKEHKFMWLLLILNSATAYVANLSNFLVTKHTSALTLQVWIPLASQNHEPLCRSIEIELYQWCSRLLNRNGCDELTAFLLSRCWATRREQWRSWSRFCCSGTQWRWWALEGTPLPCSGSSPTEKRSGDSSESSRLSSSTRIKIFVLMKGHSLEITPPRHYRCSLYIHF